MSYQVGTLDITANTSTVFQAPNEGVKAILIGNESGLTVTVTMESGSVQKTLYPSMLDWFAVNKGFTGNIKITPVVILNNVSSFPASTLIFDAIGLNDSEDASMYPVHMPRNTNIGNTINTVGGSANAIINDNNAPGTSIVEATNNADGASAVTLNNSGNLALGNATHHGSISTDNAKVTTDGAGNLTVNGTNGIILGNGKLGHTSAGDLIDAVSVATELHITTSGGDIVFYSPAGNEVGRVDNAGTIHLPGSRFSINGSTSGTATATCTMTGGIKFTLVVLNNFRNGSAPQQFLTLPVAYTTALHGWNSGCGNYQVLLSGAAKTIQELITLNNNADNGVAGLTTLKQNWLWHCDTGIDQMAFNGSDVATHSGQIILIGV